MLFHTLCHCAIIKIVNHFKKTVCTCDSNVIKYKVSIFVFSVCFKASISFLTRVLNSYLDLITSMTEDKY